MQIDVALVKDKVWGDHFEASVEVDDKVHRAIGNSIAGAEKNLKLVLRFRT